MKLRTFKRQLALTTIGCLPLLTACQHIDVAQITYEALRADDCRRNRLEDFCGRTYATEYNDYVRLRRDFLRDKKPGKLHEQNNGVTLHKVLDRH